MRNREQMRKVLESQRKIWSAKPFEQLVAELKETQNYEVEADSVVYQVEVEIFEKSEESVRVEIGIDDGHLPSSIFPLSDSFMVRRDACPADPDRSEDQR